MPTVSTEFIAPCGRDRAILAIQDTLEQLKWSVRTMTSTRVVALYQPMPQNFARITLTASLAEERSGTHIRVSAGAGFGMFIDGKKRCADTLGTFVNSVSLRLQTESLAINPTVALGEGQSRERTPSLGRSDQSRVDQLARLKELLDAGVVNDEEFQREKRRILDSP